MWQNKLSEIIKEKLMYKEKINVGALEEEIQLFKRCVIEELNIILPDEFLNI